MGNDEGRALMEETVRDFLDGITDFGNVKDRICFRLVNTERNRDFLSAAPHRNFMDLSTAYYICFEMPDGRFASVAVNDRIMEDWGVTEDQLWDTAFANTQKIFPADVGRIHDVMAELAGAAMETPDEESGMVIVTNGKKWYGAGAVFYDVVLTRLTDILGEKIFLLPSSVHEFIALTDDGKTDPAILAEMVRNINREMVSEKEYLSDSVYHYEKDGEIKIVS